MSSKLYDVINHETQSKLMISQVLLLLKKGNNPTNIGNNAFVAEMNGYTLLHVACLFGHFYVVGLLLLFGADAMKKDFNGDTPLDVAENEDEFYDYDGYSKICSLLRPFKDNTGSRFEVGMKIKAYRLLHQQILCGKVTVSDVGLESLISHLRVLNNCNNYEKFNLYNSICMWKPQKTKTCNRTKQFKALIFCCLCIYNKQVHDSHLPLEMWFKIFSFISI